MYRPEFFDMDQERIYWSLISETLDECVPMVDKFPLGPKWLTVVDKNDTQWFVFGSRQGNLCDVCGRKTYVFGTLVPLTYCRCLLCIEKIEKRKPSITDVHPIHLIDPVVFTHKEIKDSLICETVMTPEYKEE